MLAHVRRPNRFDFLSGAKSFLLLQRAFLDMCSDSNLYLNFVKASERLSNESFKKEKGKGRHGDVEGTLSGNEAKEFYDSVLASSSSKLKTSTYSNRGENTQTFDRSNSRSRTRKRQHQHSEIHNSVDSSCDGRESSKQLDNSVDTKGSNIRLVNKYLQAAQNGNGNEIEKILNESKCFDVNVCDQYGWTGIMCGAYSGHSDVVRCLLTKGALWKDVLNCQGQTALDLAKLAKNQTVISLLENWHSVSSASSVKRRRLTNKMNVPFWCPVCQQEFNEDQKKHLSSTVHQFNRQHKPKEVFYSIPENNPGYKLMVKSGWDDEKGLGPEGEGRKYPIKTVLKRDRHGLGSSNSSKARVTHFGPHDEGAVKRQQITEKTGRKESQKTLSKKQKRKKESKEKAWERNMRLYMNS